MHVLNRDVFVTVYRTFYNLVLTPRIRQEIASIRVQTRRVLVKFASIRVKYPEFFTNAQVIENNVLLCIKRKHIRF